MKHILITGGSGFIASHLVEHILVNTNWQITVIDSLSYAGDPYKLFDSEHFDPARVKMLYWDLNAAIPGTMTERIGKVDYVVNMASMSHVDRSIDDPVPFVRNNVNVALAVLEWCREAKPRKVIHFGSDEELGAGTDFDEWAPAIPSNPYAASKSAQTSLAVAWWRTYGVPTILTKTTNNFGERQHPEKLIPKAIRTTLVGAPMPIHAEKRLCYWKPGERVWIHARSTASAIMFILKNVKPVTYPEADRPHSYNITSDDVLDNLQVVQKVAQIMGREANIQFVDAHDARPGHDRLYGLNNSKLKALGWKPPMDFDASLEKTVKWTLEHKEWLL